MMAINCNWSSAALRRSYSPSADAAADEGARGRSLSDCLVNKQTEGGAGS